MNKYSIIITSPSINTSENVSGISNLTRLLLEKNPLVNYIHFTVGKKDSQYRNAKWLINQIILVFSFINKLYKNRKTRIVHINIPLSELSIFINLILVILSKLFRKKVIVHFRGGALSLNNQISRIQKFIIGLNIVYSDKIIVLGLKEYQFILDFFKIENAEKISILPNSVDIPPTLSGKKGGLPAEDGILKIIYIGRLDKNKGLKEILLALKNLNPIVRYHFYVAGTGPDYKTFISECHEYLGENFSYVGVLDSITKIPFFQAADIFLLPSYFEGLPNALLEAMAYGIVPIVTPVGSIPEVVTNAKNGFIVPIKDHQAIADKITLLYHDRILLHQMGIASNQTTKESYSIDKYIINLNGIYDTVLNK